MYVIGLVAMRQLRDLLGEVGRVVQRRDHRITDQVVDVGRAGGPGKASQLACTGAGRCAITGSRVSKGRALQVDQEIDAVVADGARHLLGLLARSLMKCSPASTMRSRIGLCGRQGRC